MRKSRIVALAVGAAAAVAIAAAAVADRFECPGTKVCPLTGEVACIDRCTAACCAGDAAPR